MTLSVQGVKAPGAPHTLAASVILPQKGPKDSTAWTFGMWAYQASSYVLVLCVMLGIAGLDATLLRPEDMYPDGLQEFLTSSRHSGAAFFSLVAGVGILLFNNVPRARAYASSSDRFTARGNPARGAIWLLITLPLLASGLTVLAALGTLFCAVLCFISSFKRESGLAPAAGRLGPLDRMWQEVEAELNQYSRFNPRRYVVWWELQVIRGQRPKIVIVVLWAFAVFALGVYKYQQTSELLTNPPAEIKELIQTRCWAGGLMDPDDDDCLTLLDKYQTWIPVAKFFGFGLNLNCSLIVLMVCQHFLMKLHNGTMHGNGYLAAFFRLLPTHKNLVFHKGIAATICIAAFIHTFAHYMAHSYTLPTLVRLGHNGKWVTLSVWATGALLLICIVVMYPISRDYVKRTNFEAFYYTHLACATVFMLSLLWHAPIFYLWAGVPLWLYMIDKYFRSQVVKLVPFKLLEVRWRPPVLQLVFDRPWKYVAGQYVWLSCPSLGREAHPFTIASAPQTGTLALAIKCWPGGWTERLRDFLASVCDKAESVDSGFAHTFEEIDWLTGQKTFGIENLKDGTSLLRIDGPHAAPAMRYLEYGSIIFAAAGIGLTPAASVLRSLVQFRWRADANCWPHSIYFCWLCAASEVPAFEWFAQELSDSDVAAAANAKIHGADTEVARDYEMHIFVTRAPPAEEAVTKTPPKSAMARLFGRDHGFSKLTRPCTGQELLQWMKHPYTKSDDMKTILEQPMERRPNAAGHINVWNGRPDWPALFKHVARQESSKCDSVGVFFCGAPAIGKDLKKNCYEHSDKSFSFQLMKESF